MHLWTFPNSHLVFLSNRVGQETGILILRFKKNFKNLPDLLIDLLDIVRRKQPSRLVEYSYTCYSTHHLNRTLKILSGGYEYRHLERLLQSRITIETTVSSFNLQKSLKKYTKYLSHHFFVFFSKQNLQKRRNWWLCGCNQLSKHSVFTICKLAQVEIFSILFFVSCLLIQNFFHQEKEENEELTKILRKKLTIWTRERAEKISQKEKKRREPSIF